MQEVHCVATATRESLGSAEVNMPFTRLAELMETIPLYLQEKPAPIWRRYSLGDVGKIFVEEQIGEGASWKLYSLLSLLSGLEEFQEYGERKIIPVAEDLEVWRFTPAGKSGEVPCIFVDVVNGHAMTLEATWIIAP